MNTFGIQKNFAEFNFEEVNVNDLEVISGGSGLSAMEGGLALMGIGACGAATGVGVVAIGIGAVMVGGAALYGYFG